LRQHGYTHDLQSDTDPRKPERRLTPQRKKKLSYRRDSRSIPIGKGASRRLRQLWPKLRRRQLRRRMKAFLRREANTLFRDVSDQTLRSIQADDTPSFDKQLPLEEALEEKRRRRVDGEKTTRLHQPQPPRPKPKPSFTRFRRRNRFGRRGSNDDIPDWLREANETDKSTSQD
jgi:hypothetical protein